MTRRTAVLPAVVLAGALALGACTGLRPAPPDQPAPAPAPALPPAPPLPRQAAFALWPAPAGLNPITDDSAAALAVMELIYPRLLRLNDQLRWEPGLAETWSASPDRTQFTFHLRTGARWSDGTPITAGDVRATWEMMAHPDVRTPHRLHLQAIQGTDANGVAPAGMAGVATPDDHTVVVRTKAPVDPDAFLAGVAYAAGLIVPEPVLATVADRTGLDRAPWAAAPRVTGGPFRFVRHVPGRFIELAKNPEYFLGQPKLDLVFYRLIPGAALAAALETGEVDGAVRWGASEVPAADWARVSRLPHLEPVPYPAPAYQVLDINAAHPHLANPMVRQAIVHAIDRAGIIDRLLHGQGILLNTPVTSLNPYHDNSLEARFTYDPDKAGKLLQEAGWDFSREVTLLVPTGNRVREQSADMIRANLQAVGMQVRVREVDFAARQDLAARGEWELSLVGFPVAGLDPDFSAQVSRAGSFNYRRLPGAGARFADQALDDLLTRARDAAAPEERRTLYAQAQHRFAAVLPMIPLYQPHALAVVNRRLANVRPGAQEVTWNAHLWDVRP